MVWDGFLEALDSYVNLLRVSYAIETFLKSLPRPLQQFYPNMFIGIVRYFF